MKKYILVMILACMSAFTTGSFACSMCKVTINGHTWLGSNEDSWRMGSAIWFETGANGKFGAVYVGYGNRFPQGGMNEAGLAFDGLTTVPKPIRTVPGKKEISDPLEFVKTIMQTCKTVEEVRQFAIQYNRQTHFNQGEYLFADRAGNYLVMESDTMITGNDRKYIIANFCPSVTPLAKRLEWGRYNRGFQYIKNHPDDNSNAYTLSLVDTMHECREKLGDGTLYSTIADLDSGDFSLYFYHDFAHEITFHLHEELAKGNHTLEIPSLFPPNKEYEKLLGFKTPQNSAVMKMSLNLVGWFFLLSGLFYSLNILVKKKKLVDTKNNRSSLILLAALSIVMMYYMFVLIKNQVIFYFPAPYRDYTFSILNVAAFIPFVLLLLMVPLLRLNARVIIAPGWSFPLKCLVTLNNMVYLAMIALFAYWGLYTIF